MYTKNDYFSMDFLKPEVLRFEKQKVLQTATMLNLMALCSDIELEPMASRGSKSRP